MNILTLILLLSLITLLPASFYNRGSQSDKSQVTELPSIVPISLNPTDSWTVQFLGSRNSKAFQDLSVSFNRYYDSLHPFTPLEANHSSRLTLFEEKERSYMRRCLVTNLLKAREIMFDRKHMFGFKNFPLPITKQFSSDFFLFTTPCLGTESLGNFFSFYFESLLCAYFSRVHYLTAAFTWNPIVNPSSTSFFSSFPKAIQHPDPIHNKAIAEKHLLEICQCTHNCHEKPTALWIRGLFLILPILTRSFEDRARELKLALVENDNNNHNFMSINPSDLIHLPANKSLVNVNSLPPIPDVAIHYRCGDNFVNPYGFLPFRIYRSLLSASYERGEIHTIYVLAESTSRVGNNKHIQMKMCNQVFPHLLHVLSRWFPTATIVIRRGDDIYLDVLRLPYANIMTICSVSTFCLWPALLQKKKAYVPISRLLVGGNATIDLGFHWLTNPGLVSGYPLAYQPVEKLLDALYEGIKDGERKHYGKAVDETPL